MPDATERLTEAALRPLAEDPAQHQAGMGLLASMVQASHPGADAMIARWDAVDARPGHPLWRRALAVALVLLSAWVWVSAVREGLWYKRALGSLGFGTWVVASTNTRAMIEEIGGGLGEREKLLLFGDLSKKSESERMLALWNSAPDHPAYFAEYAITYRVDHGEYPPDFLATARRLDPDNAWFIYQAAADLAHNAVKKEKQSSQARKAGETPTWILMDEARLNQALALLGEAGKQKHCVNRQKELVAARIPLLPQANQISRMASLCYVSGFVASDFSMRFLTEAVAAKAWLSGEAGDAAGFRQVLGDADAFVAAFGRMDHPTLVEVLLLKANAAMMVRNLQAAAEKLGLEEESGRLKRIKGNLDQASADLKNRRNNEQMDRRSGLLAGSIDILRDQVKAPPPLTDDDLKPGRMTDHLTLARLGSLAVWVVLGVGLLALAVFRYCLPAWLLRLAQRMNALLLPVDWAWLLGAGVLLPFGHVTALARFTPLGGQDWGIKATGLILPTADFLALALLMLAMPVWIARWRIGRRAAAMGMGAGRSLLGWLAVVAGLAFVPVLGMSAPMLLTQSSMGRIDWNLKDHWFSWRFALLVPLMVGISGSVVRALAVAFTRQFSRAVVALALIPAYACGMLLLMVSVPVYKAAQSCWERHDPMTEVSPQGFIRYERDVANQLLKEVRTMLELEASR